MLIRIIASQNILYVQTVTNILLIFAQQKICIRPRSIINRLNYILQSKTHHPGQVQAQVKFLVQVRIQVRIIVSRGHGCVHIMRLQFLHICITLTSLVQLVFHVWMTITKWIMQNIKNTSMSRTFFYVWNYNGVSLMRSFEKEKEIVKQLLWHWKLVLAEYSTTRSSVNSISPMSEALQVLCSLSHNVNTK